VRAAGGTLGIDIQLLYHKKKGKECAYFNRKTHLHEDDWLMAPPKIGPSKSEKVYTTDIALVYFAYFSTGTSSRNITEQSE
jgi:hypothetical protein